MSPLLSAFAGSVLALSTLSYASPIPKARQGMTIHEKIPKQALSGPAHLARLYSKFKADIPQDLALALTNVDVVATPGANDAGYLCPVIIGGQTLNLDLDTGSADLWVFSTELSSWESAGHTTYDPTKSGSATEFPGATWDITYADGSSASGNVYLDSVTIDNVTIGQQAVELAQEVSSSFQQDTSLDGLLGLGFSSLNTVQPQQQLTFFDNAVQQGLLGQNIFTVDLKAGKPGSFEFGYIDSSKYTGDITYTPVDNSSGFWDITATGFGFGGSSTKRQGLQSVRYSGIVDTGTSLLVLDDSLVSTYWAAVSGASYDASQGGYVFPCTATLPDLQIGIEDSVAVVPGAYMNFASIDGTTCYGGMQNNAGLGLSVFGDVFIKSQFIVFDEGNMQIGMAAKNLGGASTVTPMTTTSLTPQTSTSTQSSTPCLTSFSFHSSIFSNIQTATSSSTTSAANLASTTSIISAPTLANPSSTSYDDGMWHTTYPQSTPSSITLLDSSPSSSGVLPLGTLVASNSSTTALPVLTQVASNSPTYVALHSYTTETITTTIALTETTTTTIALTGATTTHTMKKITTLFGFPSLVATLNSTATSLSNSSSSATVTSVTSVAATSLSNTTSSAVVTSTANAYTTLTITTGTAIDATTIITIYTGLAATLATNSTTAAATATTNSTAVLNTASSVAYPTLSGYGNSSANGTIVKRSRSFRVRLE